jgi:hypothetical protein
MAYRQYAQNTSVPVGRSRSDIEDLLRKKGAKEFGYVVNESLAQIGFRLEGRMLRFTIPVPQKCKKPEQEERRGWRALLLSIKSKLVAVENGISTFEEEFLAHIVVPGDGRTLGEAMIPELDDVYKRQKMPKLLAAMVGQ